MIKPTNYTLLGQNGPDAIKFVRTDSTQTIRKDLTVVRKASVYNRGSNSFSVPEYRIVLRTDASNSEDLPTGQRLSLDTTLRVPVGIGKAGINEQLTSLLELLQDADFVDAVIQQRFPDIHD